MAATTPKSAVDAFVSSTRAALQCLAQVEIIGGGWELGIVNSLRVLSPGSGPSGVMTLRRTDRTPVLQLKVLLDYQVMLDTSGSGRSVFLADIARYMFQVDDLSGRELFAYHYHPYGWSRVWTPHMHVSAAQTIVLPSRLELHSDIDILLGKLHFPTHRIGLPELVRFLITELNIAPRRTDWESVLDGIRQ